MTTAPIAPVQSDPPWKSRLALLEALCHWSASVHEAGHCVEFARRGVKIIEAFVGCGGFVKVPEGVICPPSALVAGYIAETTWGSKFPRGYGSIFSRKQTAKSDFHELESQVASTHGRDCPTAEDTRQAQAIWSAEKRKLRRLIKRDKTYGQRVLTLARALSCASQGMLTGEQIEKILKSEDYLRALPEAGAA